jgi:acyl-CoA thioesterase
VGRFATDTAVTPLGDGRYAADVSDGWLIQNPNGGYLAGILVRAVLAEVADPDRRLRSVTLHYLRPGQVGPCEVHVTVERAGRGMTTATARLVQGGKDALLAVCALGVGREGPAYEAHPMPDVPRPEELEQRDGPVAMSFRDRFDTRTALGPEPFTRGPEAITGGWIRFADDEPFDDVALVLLCDAWPPAVFAIAEVPVGVPTVDLTVHLRHLPSPASEWAFVRFRTTVVADGYLEEDGEVWSEDGRLLAQSRQLAIAVQPTFTPPGIPPAR